MVKFYQEKKSAGQNYNPGNKWILEGDNFNKITFDSEEALLAFAKEAGIKLEKTIPNNNKKKIVKSYLENFN